MGYIQIGGRNMITVFVASVLAFLLGMAVGIAGYAFTTLVAWEKEIEAIFERMCQRYKNTISHKESENRRILEAYRSLQRQIKEKEEINA
jgi:H+/Cl- antiporter ClcA